MCNEHLVPVKVNKGVFNLTFIAEVFYWFWGVKKTNLLIYRHLLLFVWYAAFDTWCPFMSQWDIAMSYDPSRCCKSIWCAQTHCLVPVDTWPRNRISAQLAAFWMATWDVTEAGCVHQGRTFVQSLPNCKSHCLDHPWTASYTGENCADSLHAHLRNFKNDCKICMKKYFWFPNSHIWFDWLAPGSVSVILN